MLLLAQRATPVTIADIAGPETPTKRRIIEAGERLLGRTGIDGTALHDIAGAAGQANKYGVQYHFGDRNGLIQAVFAIRTREIDRRSNALIDIAREKGLLTNVRALLEISFLPIAEQIDSAGLHSYARFLLQFMTRLEFDFSIHHPLQTTNNPVEFFLSRIAEVVDLPAPLIMRRLYLQSLVILGVLVERDNAHVAGRAVAPLERDVGETIALMQAGIVSPVFEQPSEVDASSPKRLSQGLR